MRRSKSSSTVAMEFDKVADRAVSPNSGVVLDSYEKYGSWISIECIGNVTYKPKLISMVMRCQGSCNGIEKELLMFL